MAFQRIPVKGWYTCPATPNLLGLLGFYKHTWADNARFSNTRSLSRWCYLNELSSNLCHWGSTVCQFSRKDMGTPNNLDWEGCERRLVRAVTKVWCRLSAVVWLIFPWSFVRKVVPFDLTRYRRFSPLPYIVTLDQWGLDLLGANISPDRIIHYK